MWISYPKSHACRRLSCKNSKHAEFLIGQVSDLQPDSVISGIHAIMQIYKFANTKTDLNPDDAYGRLSLQVGRALGKERKLASVFVGQQL